MIIWIYISTYERMILSVLGSIIYAIMESCFYKLTDGYYFTTWHQFFANLIYVPFMIEDYRYLISNICLLYPVDIWLFEIFIRCLLFPINIWLFELLMGLSIIAFVGHNPAWHYKTKYSYFKGQIAFDLYSRWFLLGIFQECAYPILRSLY